MAVFTTVRDSEPRTAYLSIIHLLSSKTRIFMQSHYEQLCATRSEPGGTLEGVHHLQGSSFAQKMQFGIMPNAVGVRKWCVQSVFTLSLSLCRRQDSVICNKDIQWDVYATFKRKNATPLVFGFTYRTSVKLTFWNKKLCSTMKCYIMKPYNVNLFILLQGHKANL